MTLTFLTKGLFCLLQKINELSYGRREKKNYLGYKLMIETQAKLVELNEFPHATSSLYLSGHSCQPFLTLLF